MYTHQAINQIEKCAVSQVKMIWPAVISCNANGAHILVSRNGASKSGILAAMCLILERLELDLEVDVYQAVKQIRINRPQFIENFVSCFATCFQDVAAYRLFRC